MLKKPRAKRTYKEVSCTYCKNTFTTHRESKYCSTICCNRDRLLGKGVIQPKPCIICGNIYKPQRQTTRFCSNVCSSQHKSQDPLFIKNLKAGCVKRSQDPAYLQKLSGKAIERWNTPEFRNKMEEIFTSDDFAQKSNENYLTKDYIFSSGRIVRVQGYEPQALDILLQTYDEKDLFIGSEIKNEIGIITYLDESKNLHRYNPDIYIKSLNKIIEVKSQWTYNVQLDTNIRKKIACEDLGINFEFMIL